MVDSMAGGRLNANNRTAGAARASVSGSEMPNRRQKGAASAARRTAAGTMSSIPSLTACFSICRRLVPSRSLVNTPTKGPVVWDRPLIKMMDRLPAMETTLNADRPAFPARAEIIRFRATPRSTLHRLFRAAGLPAAIIRGARDQTPDREQRWKLLPFHSRAAQPSSAVVTLAAVQPSATPASPISNASTQNNSSPTQAAARNRNNAMDKRCRPSSFKRK